MLRRSVGTERFLRRGRRVAAVAVPNGGGGRTTKSGLVPLGSTEADTVARTIPALREVGELADRGCPTVTTRRRRRDAPGIVVLIHAVEAIERFG